MDEAKGIKAGYRVGDNTRRLVYSLVLIPIVPMLAAIGTVASVDFFGRRLIDNIGWSNFFSALMWVAAIIAIWRKVIVWTLGRKWLTAIVSFIPFVQIVYGQALWNSGCVDQELRLSQFQVGVGVWIWVSVWVWWIWERRHMKKVSDSGQISNRRLPENVVRVVASIGILPAMFGIFFISFFAFDELFGISESRAFVCVYTLVATLTVLIWLRIWWGAVAWSQRVLWKTVLWAMALMVVPSLGILISGKWHSFLDTIFYFIPVIGWGIWMAGTVRYWPMKIASGVNGMTPKCLQCGYLLTGLRGTRCPECGDEPTLDELWAATAGEGL